MVVKLLIDVVVDSQLTSHSGSAFFTRIYLPATYQLADILSRVGLKLLESRATLVANRHICGSQAAIHLPPQPYIKTEILSYTYSLNDSS